MKLYSLEETIGENSYPGRGILLGRSVDGRSAVIAYFIMGRSANSRNRIFLANGEGLRTQAFDISKMVNPSLIIYSPVRVLSDMTIVTNGDQTDTVYDFLSHGKTFEEALRTRTFEPDRPNFTPRISGLVETGGRFCYRLSILKSGDLEGKSVQRFFYEYDAPANGEGRLIQTYLGDGNPLPPFEGEPVHIAVEGTIEEFSNRLWTNLNPENKVSLFVRFINLESGLSDTRIFNKNLEKR